MAFDVEKYHYARERAELASLHIRDKLILLENTKGAVMRAFMVDEIAAHKRELIAEIEILEGLFPNG